MKNAYFAGGCFWCISSVFCSVDGVKDVVSGYSGGKEVNPTYQEVKQQKTGHRETIKVVYDEKTVSYAELLEVFFASVDPFDQEGQFIDKGHSYTLAIYCATDDETAEATKFLQEKQRELGKPVYVAVEKFSAFYDAEEYHQKWSEKHLEEFQKELEESGRLRPKEQKSNQFCLFDHCDMKSDTVNTDYKIEALRLLLNVNCISERYYPLVEQKEAIISALQRLGIKRKSDAEKLSDSMLEQIVGGCVALLRRFFAMYDVKKAKFNELASLDDEKKTAFCQLYHLPGVKTVRAELYYRSGYTSLCDVANSSAEEIIARTSATISANNLHCIAPLPKEARTHVAVAKAFTLE